VRGIYRECWTVFQTVNIELLKKQLKQSLARFFVCGVFFSGAFLAFAWAAINHPLGLC
jgi:hypothetical protein